MSNRLYAIDLHAWADEQASLLRSGRLSDQDRGNIAEAIESLGRSEARELDSRLEVLLLHLLAWQAQPALAGSSWRAAICVQRRDIARLLTRNPSLRPNAEEAIGHAFANAVIRAADDERTVGDIPVQCPWTLDEALDHKLTPTRSRPAPTWAEWRRRACMI